MRQRREARGWTRRELAQHTGISERFLAEVERGAANPSLLRLLELAQALGMGLADLLEGAASAGRRMVALLGLRGAGKSSVGPLLAERLGRPFLELDRRIEAATGLSLEELFQFHGEAYFRRAEHDALRTAATDHPDCVLAVGGGVVTDPASMELLRSVATTVWLQAAPRDHWERVVAQGDLRPMADNDRAFQDLCRILAEREPLYRRADLTVATGGRTVAAVADEIADRLARREAVGESRAVEP